jgi:exosortase
MDGAAPIASGKPETVPGTARPPLRVGVAAAILGAGIAALVLPTLADIARLSWDTEQGAHGPIVLAISIWLFLRSWPEMRARAVPGSALIGVPLLIAALLAFVATHIVGSIMLQSAALYASLVVSLYLLMGLQAMRVGWFPILYFLFVLPPPGSFVALTTQPLRLEISSLAVSILSAFGLPVAREGLLIYVDQYAIEVKAACSGLSSIISLTAVGLFYAYALHRANPRYCLFLTLAALGLAVVANLARVIIVMLITYYLGNEAGQGFLHGAAGMFMFLFALLGLIGLDWVISTTSRRGHSIGAGVKGDA